MDYEPDGTQELLIDSAQERTARRTEHLLLAARLSFFFFHGLLIISASMGFQEVSWWLIFTPAWLGDTICLVLVVLSWFGSCPYVQSCLQERQARLGDANPSILTDILPDIVMGILSLVYMLLALLAELLLCRYLSELSNGFDAAPVAPVVVFMLVSTLTCCRGVCIFTSSVLFCCIGLAALSTCVLVLALPGQPTPWVLFVPWAAAVLCLLIAAVCQLQRCRSILCREEVLLRILELVVLTLVLSSVLVTIVELAPSVAVGDGGRYAGIAGVVAGTGICALSALHARMAMAESRFGAVSERLLIAEMSCQDPGTSLRSSVISGVGLEVGGDLSLSARSGPGSWRSGRMIRVVGPPDPEVADAATSAEASEPQQM
ncbi:unnamed protein product [Symbiodinium natans]|uniref:Transmembrane protein n=1 Tax=Symbiodinium natans TaxID=878477 RepID=A0A812K6Y8_9DINO|nr:unnamed protein product [Symbiodinium natans]